MNRQMAEVAIVFVFLAGLTWLTFHEPGIEDADDRGPIYEFSDPDDRSEPAP